MCFNAQSIAAATPNSIDRLHDSTLIEMEFYAFPLFLRPILV